MRPQVVGLGQWNIPELFWGGWVSPDLEIDRNPECFLPNQFLLPGTANPAPGPSGDT